MRDERGASAVEYALLVALVVAVSVAALWVLGMFLGGVFEDHACRAESGYECD